MFFEGDLQRGIALAVEKGKAVLCFVYDDTDVSEQWEATLNSDEQAKNITRETVALRLRAGSQEAGFLSGICPVESIPAVIVIKHARLLENLQSAEVGVDELNARLASIFDNAERSSSIDSNPVSGPEYIQLEESTGRMRLPNNAYDALRAYTQSLLDKGVAGPAILQRQLDSLSHLSEFESEVEALREQAGQSQPKLSTELQEKLLKTPASEIQSRSKTSINPNAASGHQNTSTLDAPNTDSSSNIPNQPSQSQSTVPSNLSSRSNSRINPQPQAGNRPRNPGIQEQREDYVKMQKEREERQKQERERIKAQIKADREERRRLEDLRKHGISDSTDKGQSQAIPKTIPTDIRLQVRTFDGSTIRKTFPPSANLSKDIRPWIDSSIESSTPYNLKLVLNPLPNRTIELAEEDHSIADLGISRSATMVMVPVKGYVESYTGTAPSGILGTAISGSYNLVAGTAGALFGGVKSILGYSQEQQQATLPSSSGGSNSNASQSNNQGPSTQKQVRVRTLADQRAESKGQDQQFYNGNQLNFQPKKDDNEDAKND